MKLLPSDVLMNTTAEGKPGIKASGPLTVFVNNELVKRIGLPSIGRQYAGYTDYQQDLRDLQEDPTLLFTTVHMTLLFAAARHWQNNWPYVVKTTDEAYTSLINRLPYLKNERLFTVLLPEQYDFLDKAIKHYNTRRSAELHRPYIIRTETDLKMFESLPEYYKTDIYSGLFLRPIVIPPKMPASDDASYACSSSATQDNPAPSSSHTSAESKKRPERENNAPTNSAKKQRAARNK